VRSGDTLGAIARRLGVPIGAIHGYRSGNPNLIYVGETIAY
jgi:LysM repeat protein